MDANKILEIRDKARQKALHDYVLKYEKSRISELGAVAAYGLIGMAELTADTLDYFRQIDEAEGIVSKKNTVAYFVTWSPDPALELSATEVYDVMKKIAKPLKGVLWSLGSIEQSGTLEEQDIGRHPHCHVLIYRDTSVQTLELGKLKRRLESYIKPYRTKTCMDLQVKCVSERSLPNKIAYVEGRKQPHKMRTVEADRVWREANELEDYYRFGDKIPPLALSPTNIVDPNDDVTGRATARPKKSIRERMDAFRGATDKELIYQELNF